MLARLGVLSNPATGALTLSAPDPYECDACQDTGWTVGEDRRAFHCPACSFWSRIRQERIDRVFAGAHIPRHFAECELANWPGPDAVLQEAIAWERSEPVGGRSLFLHGKYGVGKTSLAVSLMRARVETTACDALFQTAPELLDRIRASYRRQTAEGPQEYDDAEAEVILTVQTTTLLVLDDLGAERVTPWVQERLFVILNYRHDHHLATIFTSNLDYAQLRDHIGERVTWRVREMAQALLVDGANLRLGERSA